MYRTAGVALETIVIWLTLTLVIRLGVYMQKASLGWGRVCGESYSMNCDP